MTISTTTVSQSYSGNGSTTAFTFTFPINSTSELKVIERSATGAETVKSVGTGSANYAIVDNGASGGTVTMVTAPAAGTTLVLIRDTSLTQESDYVENDPFAAETHEDALDKLQMQIQEVQEEVDRSMKISRTNTMTSTEFTNSATDRASKVLAFDSSGELSVTQELGSFKGGSATTTTAAYVIRDIVKGTTTAQLNNIYICIQASPIGTALTNTSFWTLIVDAVSAATSATTATTKASEAATSATNAAASLDSFDDRYLGAKSSDPSADNDGDGLATGAIYFKTDGTGFKVYNGSAWKDIRPTDAQQTAIDTVAGANSNISALAASAVITDMALLATTDVIADMALLATSDVISDMNALAVSDVISDINTLATSDIVSDLNTLATSDIVSDINTLATSDIVSDLNTLATSDIVADINTLATSDIVTDLNLLATSDFVSDLNALSTSTNVTNMANLNASGVITNIANLNGSGVVANIATVAGAVSNVNTTAGAIANVNSVASNIASVNNFGEVYRIASSAPSSSLTAGDLYFNTSTNVLNVYGASGWQNAGSSVNGTSQRYHYDISGTPTAVTGNDAAGNTLAYDAGFIDVFLNGVRMSTADVTVTSGDTVTFASALANGDEVDIVAYGTFAVAAINADNLNSGSVPAARFGAGTIPLTALNIDAGTDIGAAIVDADLFIVDDGAGGTNRKTTAARLKTYIGSFNADAAQVFNESGNDVDTRIESSGNANMLFVDGGDDDVRIGTATTFGNNDAGLKVKGGITIGDFTADSAANNLMFVKSRNTTVGSQTIVSDDDEIGRIAFKADDGDDTSYNNNVAAISCQIDGTPGTNDTPGRLIFETTPDGARVGTEKMRITSAGRVGVGTNDPDMLLDVTGAIAAGAGTDEDLQQWNIGSDNVKAKMTYLDASANRGFAIGTSSQHDFFLRTDNNIGLKVDINGAVTKPLQPAVLAYSSSAQNDIATGVVKINLDAEIYDVNGDFNTGTYTFTAPVTGKYMVSGQIGMTDVDTAFQWIYMLLTTSNRIYYMDLIDPRIEISSDGTHTWTGSALVDMDANDTLYLATRSSAHGAAQNNITSASATAPETFMSVYLAC